MNDTPLIWTLLDPKPGHRNQTLGVAEALGMPFVEKELVYTETANSPNWLKWSRFGLEAMGLDIKNSTTLQSPWPDVVIACGRRSEPIARYIQHKSKGKTKCCQLMWPGFPNKHLDLIAVPTHDGRKQTLETGGNILNTHGPAHRVTPAFLNQHAATWKKQLGHLEQSVITVLLGGNTKKGDWDKAISTDLAKMVATLSRDLKASLLVSTSRRTPDQLVHALKQATHMADLDDVHMFEWDAEADNPYYGYLGLADAIIVTGDSISMVSEACASGKPVFVYAPDALLPSKHQRFLHDLETKGFIQRLTHQSFGTIEYQLRHNATCNTPLLAAEDIAEHIKGWT